MFARKPDKFTEKTTAEFMDTLYFSGYIRSADKLFTEEKTELPPLIFHVFNYDFQGVKYEVKISDEDEKERFITNTEYEIFINPEEPTNCWLENRELNGYLWEADDEDDEL